MKMKIVALIITISILLPLGELQAADPVAPDADIIIDAGHGGIDGGTSYGNILEKDINLAIAKKTFEALSNKGYDVILNRTGDYALSDHNSWLKSKSRHRRDLAQRKQLAVDMKPKVMISLHVNWSKHKNKHGPIVLHQADERSIDLAKKLQNKLNQLCRTNEKPFLGKTYYLLNKSKCPTVIIEMGFITSSEDRARLTSSKGQAEIAREIADGVLEFIKESEKKVR